MFENDADTNSSPSQNNADSYGEYLSRAARACADGDVVLGLHLYLAAYERSIHDSSSADPAVIDGMREAWHLACQYKERSLAEYIFEKLEPYLSAEEITQCAEELQQLALDKLEEFGLSREDLEDMTDMISHDFFGVDPSALFMQVNSGISPSGIAAPLQKGLVRAKGVPPATDSGDGEGPTAVEATPDPAAAAAAGPAAVPASKALTASAGAPQPLPAGQEPADAGKQASSSAAADDGKHRGKQGKPEEGLAPGLLLPTLGALGEKKPDFMSEVMTYKDLIGYETAIETMRGFGIGMQDDPAFRELVKTLNARHGLSRVPVTDVFLFRAAVREDANQFMVASMGEIRLPVIRMRMEENFQGMPILCVMTSADNQPRLNAARNAFEGGGVLMLEDIDLWGPPLADMGNDDMNGFLVAQLSRGAREAINLIRSAVENPEVYVLASASQEGLIDDFFFDLLEPMTIVDIDLPTAAERTELWSNIAKEHPSIYGVDREALVKYSAGMSRFDIYMAAREAVEEAYKASLISRKYIPVTKENIFEKIALYQPLDSDEYLQLEDAVVDSFKNDLDNLDDLLKGQGE